jgi:hypothetical protein
MRWVNARKSVARLWFPRGTPSAGSVAEFFLHPDTSLAVQQVHEAATFMERKSSSVSNLLSRAHLPPGCRFFSGIGAANSETFVVVVLVVVQCFKIGNHPTIALVTVVTYGNH